MKPGLSIIIVAYKSYDEIGPCLQSIPRSVNDRAVEVVVVDNFPSDGIERLIAAEFPWVHYVNPQDNIGFGRANNLGFARSAGDCLLFLNPDTVVNAAALTHCL